MRLFLFNTGPEYPSVPLPSELAGCRIREIKSAIRTFALPGEGFDLVTKEGVPMEDNAVYAVDSAVYYKLDLPDYEMIEKCYDALVDEVMERSCVVSCGLRDVQDTTRLIWYPCIYVQVISTEKEALEKKVGYHWRFANSEYTYSVPIVFETCDEYFQLH